jgi:hypothetical protein
VEDDVLPVDGPVEHEPEEAARDPGRGGEARVAAPDADGDAVRDRAEQRDREEPLVAERAEDERIHDGDSREQHAEALACDGVGHGR